MLERPMHAGMMGGMGIDQDVLYGSEAILAVHDVVATTAFYKDVLGFESHWTWGEPPTFGGARWGRVQVMFCQDPALAARVEGHMHMFCVHDVDTLYQRHQSAGAPIVTEVGNRPWGQREYTVRDPNGYLLRFAGSPTYERPARASATLPAHIRVSCEKPPFEDYARVMQAVGWARHEASMHDALSRSLFWIAATDTRSGKIVGLTRAAGDGRAYTIWDVMVLPDYQGQRIGSALVEAALIELRKIGHPGAFVGLFTGKPAFYERLGFVRDIGMHRSL